MLFFKFEISILSLVNLSFASIVSAKVKLLKIYFFFLYFSRISMHVDDDSGVESDLFSQEAYHIAFNIMRRYALFTRNTFFKYLDVMDDDTPTALLARGLGMNRTPEARAQFRMACTRMERRTRKNILYKAQFELRELFPLFRLV